jgi:hypothetical protein
MKTERVTIYTTDGQIIDGVKRHWPDHVDHADMCGNIIHEETIAEVRDAG